MLKGPPFRSCVVDTLPTWMYYQWHHGIQLISDELAEESPSTSTSAYP